MEESLIDICNGIAKAKSNLNLNNPVIAPGYVEGKIQDTGVFIEFEVLISVSENSTLQVDGGANIGIFAKIKAVFSKTKSSKNQNKVCFKVPYLPQGIPPTKHDL